MDCGGRALRFGEAWEQGVRREVKEEYCTDIVKLDFVGANNIIRTHKGIKTHWIVLLFACKVDEEKVKLGDKEKMDKIGWFKPNKLPKPLHSMFISHLKYVKKAGIICFLYYNNPNAVFKTFRKNGKKSTF